ncbi:MAG: hypothetical protein DWI29_01935, partial [Planctomycetota bacterium]
MCATGRASGTQPIKSTLCQLVPADVWRNDMSSLPSKILNWGFRRYVRRFVRKNFNAVRVAGHEHLTGLPARPIVCFINHPGWWDPMTGVLMTDLLFPGRIFAAPMDVEALRSYPILERLG